MAKRVSISEEDYLSGLNEVISNLQNAVSDIKDASGQGLADAALFVLGESVKRAPVDTGDLRGSGFVDLDENQYAMGAGGQSTAINITGAVPEKATEALIGFSEPYAANQHEHTEYDHPRGGQPKYLESVLVENQERILAAIAGKIITDVFNGGGGKDA